MSELTAPDRTRTTVDDRTLVIERDDDRGVVFVHRRGELVIEPADWRDRLAAALRRLPGAGLVGAKRLDDAGCVFAMGERVVHPKGFHHVGRGTPGSAYRFPEEIDAIAGGVVAVGAKLFDAIDGAKLAAGELGMVALGLAVRAHGKRCVAVPSVIATDPHTPAPTGAEEDAFAARFGFDWLAPDLDAVATRHAGTGLLWDVRFQGVALPFAKYDERPALHWTSYRDVEVYRQRADHLAQLAARLAGNGRALDLGCGDGLFTFLAAQRGPTVVGLDPEPAAVAQARAQVAGQAPEAAAPTFVAGRGDALPFDDASFDLVFAFDVIEHLPNPVAVLRDAIRVLRPGGRLLLTTPAWRFGAWSDPTYHVTEYTNEELVRQVEAVGRRGPARLAVVETGSIGGVYRDLIVIAERR